MSECPGEGMVACDRALTQVFALLGQRWTGLVVGVLLQRPARFGELIRAIPGISDRMLSDRLTQLISAGLVVREVVEGPPLGSRYHLTERGADLAPAIEALASWARTHLQPKQAQANAT